MQGRRFLPALIGLGVLSALCAGHVAWPRILAPLQNGVFDLLQRAAPRHASGPSPVRVIDIDDESLRRYGQWPWSRDAVAALVGKLQDLGASAIALDVVFAEPDRTSPALLVSGWKTKGWWRDPAVPSAPPDYDSALASVFSRGKVVSGYALTVKPNGGRQPLSPSLAFIGGDPQAVLPRYAGAIANLEVLDRAAEGHGSFTIAAGTDEIVRRIPFLSTIGGTVVPSLALEALRVAEAEDTIKVRTERSGDTLTGFTVRIGAHDIPLEADGTLRLHLRGTMRDEAVPAWKILDLPSEAAALDLAGRIVLIGTSAVGLSDLRPTALNAYEPGVDIHAEAIEQIVSRQFLRRPAWLPGAEFLTGLGLTSVVIVLAAFAGLRLAIAAASAIGACVVMLTVFAYRDHGFVLDPGFVLIAVGLGFGATSLTRHFLAERDAVRLRLAFSHYLSPHLVEALVKNPSELKLGGETREMTFLFTDLEGFTTLTETYGAEALVQLLNAYLDGLCGVAFDHGGTVDKIVGDALHVMFNAPLRQADHASRAVACALAMDRFATAFAEVQQRRGVSFGRTRIGVNSGRAVVGNFGGSRRFDYTAHGDAINTAARLEAANKTLGTRICVAASTVELASDCDFRPIGALLLRGKSQAVHVFEPLSREDAATPANTRYVAALRRLLSGDPAGESEILALHQANPSDAVLALHARRVAAGTGAERIAA